MKALKLKEEEEILRSEEYKKDNYVELNLGEESSNSPEINVTEQKTLELKEEQITKLESFEIDHNKKN